MCDRKFLIVPTHAAVAGHHGSRYITQTKIDTELFGGALKILTTDIKGLTYDGTDERTMDQVAEEARNVFAGVFPAHMLKRPWQASMSENEPIDPCPHDTVLLVFAANKLHDTDVMSSLVLISKRLAEFHLPSFIIITKADLIPPEKLHEIIVKVEETTGRHRAFIFPMANGLNDRELPPRHTKFQILRLLSSIVIRAQAFNPMPPPLPPLSHKIWEMAVKMVESIQSAVKSLMPAPENRLLALMVSIIVLLTAALLAMFMSR